MDLNHQPLGKPSAQPCATEVDRTFYWMKKEVAIECADPGKKFKLE